MSTVKFLAVALVIVVFTYTAAYADVPSQISFQGRLTDSEGQNVSDSTYSVTFRIYDDSTAIDPLWEEEQFISTEGGLFTTMLGSVNPIPDSVFDGSTQYLGIQIDGQPEMQDRLPIGSEAYSYHAAYADSGRPVPDDDWVIDEPNIYRLEGNVGIATANPSHKLEVEGDIGLSGAIFSDAAYGSRFYSLDLTREGGAMVHSSEGRALTLGGDTEGFDVVILPSGNVGIGTMNPNYKLHVSGSLHATTGDFYQYAGESNPPALKIRQHSNLSYPNQIALEVMGGVTDSSPKYFRVLTDNDDPWNLKVMVDGSISASTYYGDGSNLTGIEGTTDNDWTIDGDNVYHLNGNVGIGTTSPSAKTHTVTATTGQSAVKAENTTTSGSVHAIWGITNSQSDATGSAVAVLGDAMNLNSTGGATFGVMGRNRRTSGPGGSTSAGVFGWAPGSSFNTPQENYGITYGVWGETWSRADDVAGVYGVNKATHGATRGTVGAVNSTEPGAAGILGYAPGSGDVRGVLGYCHSSGGYGVLSDGNFGVVNGTKGAIVDASVGQVKLYCQESPEIWFEDFGEGQLSSGRTRVELDPLFLETVTTNDQHPMKVFIQLNDDCNGVYVKRGVNGFDVIELQGGKSNASFTYRVVAKRKGYENLRLEKTEVAQTEFTPPVSPTASRKE